jgi:hypothetical protein
VETVAQRIRGVITRANIGVARRILDAAGYAYRAGIGGKRLEFIYS